MAEQQAFSEEQIKKLQAISQLEGEQKNTELQAFLSTLTEEQKELLKTQGCVYCNIVQGGMQSFSVYEDDVVKCVLDIHPATKGHIVVVPKHHYFVSGQMDAQTTQHVFMIANTLSRIVFETMGAQGTNIFIANGHAAGQMVEHFVIHIIPRYTDDGIKFNLEGKETDQNTLTAVASQLQDAVSKLLQGGNQAAPPSPEPTAPVVEETPVAEISEDEDNVP